MPVFRKSPLLICISALVFVPIPNSSSLAHPNLLLISILNTASFKELELVIFFIPVSYVQPSWGFNPRDFFKLCASLNWLFIAGIINDLPIFVYQVKFSLNLYNVCNCGKNTFWSVSKSLMASPRNPKVALNLGANWWV